MGSVGSDLRGQRQRDGEREQRQRVVVRTAHTQHQQHRVQADERDGPPWRVPRARGRPRDQSHRAGARDHGDRLEGPHAAREAQRHDRVAEQREQRAIRGVQKRPADEVEHRVGGRFGGEVRVRVEPVQGAQACERQVAEHVLGDQRRSEQQARVSQRDRARESGHRQSARRQQHQRVAHAHQQRQRLVVAARKADAQSSQWPSQPRGPAAAARGHVLRRR